MPKPKAKPPRERVMFEVNAGSTHFYIVADDFAGAMQGTFKHFGAKTSHDLPKPFNMRAVDTLVIVVP